MPPFRTTNRSGLVAGEGIGSCVPWMEPPLEPQPEPPDEPAPDAETASASA